MKYLLNSFLSPPNFADEDKTRIARLEYIFLWLIIFFVAIRAIGLLRAYPETIPLLWLVFFVFVINLGMLWLVRRGRVRLVAYLSSLVLWLSINIATWLSGGMDRPIFSTNLTILIFIALTLGTYATIGFAFVSILAGIGMLWARAQGLLPIPTFTTDFTLSASTQLVNLSAAAMYLGIAAHSLTDALNQARQNTRALAERNEALEKEMAERKHMEAALRESEARYRAVVENQTEFIVRCKPNGVRTFVNEAYCRYFGLTAEQALSSNFMPLVAEEDRPAVEEKIARLRAGTLINEIDIHRVIRPDGSLGWQEWLDQIIRDESGQVVEFQSVGRDITERKQTEAALQESEERFRALSEASFEGILIHKQGIIVDANQVMANLFGFQHPNELIGKNGFEILPFTPESLKIVKDRAQTEIAEPYDVNILKPDGTTFPAEVQARETTFKGDKVRVVAMRDISARKKAEQALREAEIKYRMLVEHIPNAITYLDSADPAIATYYISPQINKMLGYSPEEWVANPRSWLECLHPDDREWILARDAQLDSVGDSFNEEYRLVARDGHVVWVRDQGVVLRSDEGQPRFSQGIMIDITERKQAEAEIQQLNTELEQRVIERTAQLEAANRELEAFSYTVSHDLRAPLRGIDGFARILIEDLADQLSPDAQQYLNRIRQNAKQMNQLINDLLGFARLNRQPLHKQKILPAALAQQVFDELRLDYAQHQVDFVVGDLPFCEADPALLRQVFVNLLGNALKYSSKREVARIEVGFYMNSTESIYFVRDNGVGFNMQYAARLFGAFQRLHSASEFEGTGVGLATVQRIIQRHGGRIWAEAEEDQGATFYFVI